MLYKFIKFIAVGFSGVFIDYLITYLCKEKFKLHIYLSNSIGFIVAASSNYVFNRIWTFESANSHIGLEFTTFFVISIIGLIINNLFLFLFHQKTGAGFWVSQKFKLGEKHDYAFYIAKFMAITVTTVWNFYANYYITFSV